MLNELASLCTVYKGGQVLFYKGLLMFISGILLRIGNRIEQLAWLVSVEY